MAAAPRLPRSLDLDPGPMLGNTLRGHVVDHDQLVASRGARNQANRAARDVQLVGQEPNERHVGGAAHGRRRYPSLQHTFLGDAVDPIRSATRHQPHGESDRGVLVIVWAAVPLHYVPLSTLGPGLRCELPLIAPTDPPRPRDAARRAPDRPALPSRPPRPRLGSPRSFPSKGRRRSLRPDLAIAPTTRAGKRRSAEPPQGCRPVARPS